MATTCLGPRRGERFVEFGRDGYWAERGGGTNGNQGCGRRSLSRSSPRLLRELSQSKSQPRSTDARIPITGKGKDAQLVGQFRRVLIRRTPLQPGTVRQIVQ